MTPDKLWKKAQRRIAEMFGAENTGQVKGISSPDFVGRGFVGEVKQRKQLPAWLKSAMAQAEGYVDEAHPLAVLVLHETGGEYERDFAVVRLGDFANLLKS